MYLTCRSTARVEEGEAGVVVEEEEEGGGGGRREEVEADIVDEGCDALETVDLEVRLR